MFMRNLKTARSPFFLNNNQCNYTKTFVLILLNNVCYTILVVKFKLKTLTAFKMDLNTNIFSLYFGALDVLSIVTMIEMKTNMRLLHIVQSIALWFHAIVSPKCM